MGEVFGQRCEGSVDTAVPGPRWFRLKEFVSWFTGSPSAVVVVEQLENGVPPYLDEIVRLLS